ncbi:MAG TPA: DUF4129 domain-containing protein [Pirellulales bacterium]|jgi:hypothetical protein|nr:DUF4129 domain-containing protein [Pirellulales bacterium]
MFSSLIGAASLPDPDVIRRTADEVVRRPEFQLEPVRDSSVLQKFLVRLWMWFLKLLSQLWDISPVLAWLVVIFLIAALVALIVHIVYTLRQGLRSHIGLGATLLSKRRQLDPVQLERQSEEAANRHDYIGAVRLLFRAAVLRLDQHTGRAARPGMTNREYLARYRASSVIDALGQFVDVIDAKWYGYGECDVEDYRRCRQAHALIHGTDRVL